VDKTKEFLEKDISETREDIYNKIDYNDQRCLDEIRTIKERA